MSNKDTFPGSLHVRWGAVDHVRDSVMSALGRKSGPRKCVLVKSVCRKQIKTLQKQAYNKLLKKENNRLMQNDPLSYLNKANCLPALCTLHGAETIKRNAKQTQDD